MVIKKLSSLHFYATSQTAERRKRSIDESKNNFIAMESEEA
jgi:hypothetical protein